MAAFRRPAGKFNPILSSLSLKARPPFFDLALSENKTEGLHHHNSDQAIRCSWAHLTAATYRPLNMFSVDISVDLQPVGWNWKGWLFRRWIIGLGLGGSLGWKLDKYTSYSYLNRASGRVVQATQFANCQIEAFRQSIAVITDWVMVAFCAQFAVDKRNAAPLDLKMQAAYYASKLAWHNLGQLPTHHWNVRCCLRFQWFQRRLKIRYILSSETIGYGPTKWWASCLLNLATVIIKSVVNK